MSDFVINYDVLEAIANRSNNIGKQADEYANRLTGKVANAIRSVTGASSYLEDASYYVNEKIRQLEKKSDEFYAFAGKLTDLKETAVRVDEEVQHLLARSQETFLQHHETLRIDGWKAAILSWLIDLKNKLPFLEVLANILSAIDTLQDSFLDALKYWYHCEGGKYIIELAGAVVLAVIAVVGLILISPASMFVMVCGAIAAGIEVANAFTNVYTTSKAISEARDGNPAWARIYSKQDKLSDVLRETNFHNGFLNRCSNMGASALNITETLCGLVCLGAAAKGVVTLFRGKNLSFLKKGAQHLSDFKASLKKGFTNSIDDLKGGFRNFKTSVKDGFGKLKGMWKSKIASNVDDAEDIVKGGSQAVDFYVAPNGKTLPGQYKDWLGTNMRDSIMDSVSDPTLKMAIGEIYRPGSIIGDGGTADIIRFEQETGIFLSKSGHIQKGIDVSKYFQKLIDSGILSPSDTQVTQEIINSLQSALGGK